MAGSRSPENPPFIFLTDGNSAQIIKQTANSSRDRRWKERAMSLRNQKRAAILNRLKRSCNVRQFMKEENFTAAQVADAVLALEAAAIKQLGGPARFTGNTRT